MISVIMYIIIIITTLFKTLFVNILLQYPVWCPGLKGSVL